MSDCKPTILNSFIWLLPIIGLAACLLVSLTSCGSATENTQNLTDSINNNTDTTENSFLNAYGWALLGPNSDGRILSVVNGSYSGISGMDGRVGEQFVEPTLLIDGNRFRVWFTKHEVIPGNLAYATGYAFTNISIAYMESYDRGRTWSPPQGVIANYARSYVYKHTDGLYYLFAVNAAVPNVFSPVDVLVSPSGDPGTFVLLYPGVIAHSASGPDSGGGGIGNVVPYYENGMWYLFYEAKAPDGSGWKINVASGTSLTSLVKYSGNPIINRGPTTSPGSVVKIAGTYYLFGHFSINPDEWLPAQQGHLSAPSLMGPWTWQGWDITYTGGQQGGVADASIAYDVSNKKWYAFYEWNDSEFMDGFFCLARYDGVFSNPPDGILISPK